MSETASRLSIGDDDDGTTLVLAGEIDAHTAPDLAERLGDLPGNGGDITIEMAAVEFIDSSGLRVLIDVHNRAAQADRRLVLRSPSASVIRLVEIAGLADHFNLDS